MKFTSIATGSGWHGPMYVHTLDRPFRLYQLEEFSVIGQLVQSSNTNGKTYVGLFDENKRLALLVFWGDSWVGSKKGYFNVYYYPQSGGYYTQGSGYLYYSFTKTGKLWWGPYHGGDGAVFASIDGAGSSQPIGEVENASRVIKYVGVLGYRMDSYTLVDMRLHDVNVVADLNEQNPNSSTPPPTRDPPAGETQSSVDYDGTSSSPKASMINADVDLSAASLRIATFWTGWWPLLHFVVDVSIAPDQVPAGHPAKPAEGKLIHISVAKNLFGITEDQQIEILGDGSFGQPSDEILNQQVDLLSGIMLGSLNLALIGLEIASSTGNAPAVASFIASTVILTLSFFGLVDWFQQKMLDEGKWTHYECFHQWLMIGLGIIINMLMVGALSMFLNFIDPLTPVATIALEWASEMAPIRTIAAGAKLAFFYLLAMAITSFLRALRHLIESF